MKILMIAPGHSIHSKRPLNWLLENGCDVTFVDSIDPYPEGRDRYHFVPYPTPRGRRYYKIVGERLANWLSLWTVALQLRLLWQRVRPDVVHVHWIDHRAYECVKAGLKPLILSVWGTDINRHFLSDAHPENRWITGKALAGANLVIVEVQCMSEKCAILARRKISTEFLHLGVDTRLFRPGYQEDANKWRQRLGIPTDVKVLLSPRGWNRMYGHHLILEAFALSRPLLKTDACLVFVMCNEKGYSDSKAYEEEIRCGAEELHISRWVRWMNEVPMSYLPQVYAFADIVINYPSMDSFPVTFLEAAACEKPVITCRLPSYEKTFAEEYFGMVDPGNIAELVNAIVKEVNQDPAERAMLLSEARRVVEQDYHESTYVKRLLKIYREIS